MAETLVSGLEAGYRPLGRAIARLETEEVIYVFLKIDLSIAAVSTSVPGHFSS